MAVRTESLTKCILCGASGSVLYPRVTDRLFGNEGEFGEVACPTCGLVWLSPRPLPEDMGRYYEQYYTHHLATDDVPAGVPTRCLGGLRDAIRGMILCGYYGYTHCHPYHRWCSLGKALGRLAWLRLRATNELKELLPFYRKDGVLLDIGCGRGDFLLAMRTLGWKVLGVEIDPVSSALAHARGLTVQNVSFEAADIPAESVDHITMNHVIEHFFDPVAVVKKCYRVLRVGGTMAVYAPNARSLGHRMFKEYWLALDPPRHLNVFSCRNVRALLANGGFESIRTKTSPRLAAGIYDTSVMFRRGIVTRGQAPSHQGGRRAFALREKLACAFGLERGEEIVALARKQAHPS
jgi:SAM-dependent methyltransferase